LSDYLQKSYRDKIIIIIILKFKGLTQGKASVTSWELPGLIQVNLRIKIIIIIIIIIIVLKSDSRVNSGQNLSHGLKKLT